MDLDRYLFIYLAKWCLSTKLSKTLLFHYRTLGFLFFLKFVFWFFFSLNEVLAHIHLEAATI